MVKPQIWDTTFYVLYKLFSHKSGLIHRTKIIIRHKKIVAQNKIIIFAWS